VIGGGKLKRVGNSVPGMHAFSGSWVLDKVENISEYGMLTTFEQTADGLKMSEPTGEHFDAKLDGKEYPYAGSPSVDKVILKRVGADAIEETDKHGDKVVSTAKITAAPDGRAITLVVHEHDGRVNTYVFDKQ
jgi:hypothetical protein